jgi:hypothetical protein
VNTTKVFNDYVGVSPIFIMKKYEYKSQEEKEFSYYLDELQSAGLIEGFTYEEVKFELTPKVTFPYVKTTQLKTKVKKENKVKVLLNDSTYTPDFIINFEPKSAHFANMPDKFPLFITSRSTLTSYVDVKASFGKKASDIRFPDRQKQMYNIHRIYIQKIVPRELFEQSFTPQKVIDSEVYVRDCKWGKKGECKLKFKPITLQEWLKTL